MEAWAGRGMSHWVFLWLAVLGLLIQHAGVQSRSMSSGQNVRAQLRGMVGGGEDEMMMQRGEGQWGTDEYVEATAPQEETGQGLFQAMAGVCAQLGTLWGRASRVLSGHVRLWSMQGMHARRFAADSR